MCVRESSLVLRLKNRFTRILLSCHVLVIIEREREHRMLLGFGFIWGNLCDTVVIFLIYSETFFLLLPMDISLLMNHANSCIPCVFVCARLLPPSTSGSILQIATTFWMFHLPQHSNQELDQERCFTSGCNNGAMRGCGNWRRNGGDGGDRALIPKVKKEREKKWKEN